MRSSGFSRGCRWAFAVLLGWAIGASAGFAQERPGRALLVMVAAPASYLGVNIHDIDEHAADALRVKPGVGVEVTAIDHDAPAGKAGLRLRDVILVVDSKQVAGEAQFREIMRGYPPGKQVRLIVVRDGRPVEFKVTLADRAKLQQQALSRPFHPPLPRLGSSFASVAEMQRALNADPGDATGNLDGAMTGSGASGPTVSPIGPGDHDAPQARLDDRRDAPPPFGYGTDALHRGMGWGLGAQLAPIGPQLAGFFGVKEGTGLLVMNVDADTPAAVAGLQAGDVVLKMDEEALAGPLDWVRGLEASQGKPMTLTVVRNKRVLVLALSPVSHTQARLERQRPCVLPAA